MPFSELYQKSFLNEVLDYYDADETEQAETFSYLEEKYNSLVELWNLGREIRTTHPEIDRDIFYHRLLLCLNAKMVRLHPSVCQDFLDSTSGDQLRAMKTDQVAALVNQRLNGRLTMIYDHELESGPGTGTLDEAFTTVTEDLFQLMATNVVDAPQTSFADTVKTFVAELKAQGLTSRLAPLADRLAGWETQKRQDYVYAFLLLSVLRYTSWLEVDNPPVSLNDEPVDQQPDTLDLHIELIAKNPLAQTWKTLRALSKLIHSEPQRGKTIRGVSHLLTGRFAHTVKRFLIRECQVQADEIDLVPDITFSDVIEAATTDQRDYPVSASYLLTIMITSLHFSPEYQRQFLTTGELPTVGVFTIPSDKFFVNSAYNTKTSSESGSSSDG